MALLYQDPRFLLHGLDRHPECPERLRRVYAEIASSGLANQFRMPDFLPATPEQLKVAHRLNYIGRVERVSREGGGWIGLDSDTAVSQHSFEAAELAAGSVIDAVDAVMTGPDRQAVCLVRPPGHHALPATAMGFCLFNNVGIGAIYAQKSYLLERILIVDWDVHHGNGTQHLFYHDHVVYFASVHRAPFFPGTGSVDETGEGDGLGTIFNLPLPYGVPRKEFLTRFEELLNAAAARCQPELVLLSAGFDAHHADPVGSLSLETEDFEQLTDLVLSVAREYCDGKLVSVLEGGYNVDILPECVSLHLKTILRA